MADRPLAQALARLRAQIPHVSNPLAGDLAFVLDALAKAESDVAFLTRAHGELEAELVAVRQEAATLRETLLEYGKHQSWCSTHIRGSKGCDCGWSEALTGGTGDGS